MPRLCRWPTASALRTLMPKPLGPMCFSRKSIQLIGMWHILKHTSLIRMAYRPIVLPTTYERADPLLFTLSARLLHEAGCRVMVTLRTYRHGETVVPSGCEAQPYDRRFELLSGVDIVVSATASPHYTVTVEQLEPVAQLPQVMVDLAIPRDIEPQVGQLPGVKLFNVDDLMDTAPLHTVPPEVTEILDKHQRQFYRWLNYKVSLPLQEELKLSIVQRLSAAPQLTDPGMDQEEIIALTVGRTVELLLGGLPTPPDPDSLRQCAQKIRAYTTGKGAPA